MINLRFCFFFLLVLAAPLQGAEKRALLIGINDYLKGPPSWDLRGCLNDVEMTRDLLMGKFGFPEENIKTLIDSQATAAGIVQAMEEWLIAATRAEDIVYFHFSGHGSQVQDRDQDEKDGKDEMLCPADMELGNINTVITDDQLKEMFARIPSNNVTIVLDACHSGTGTRDISLSRARYVAFEPDLPAPAPVSRAVVLSPKVTGGSVEGDPLQVTVSGCKPEQTSADAWIRDGYYAGALTYHWVEELQEAPVGISYAAVLERVRRDLKAKKYTQIPQIDGDGERPLFGGVLEGAPQVSFLVAEAVEGQRVWFGQGEAQKITKGSIYALYPKDESQFIGSGLGRVEIVEVYPGKAVGASLDSMALETGLRARLTEFQLPEERLKVLLEGPGELQQAVEQALGRFDFVEVVEEGMHFDHRLRLRHDNRLEAALTVDGAEGPAVTGANAAKLVVALKSQLESAYTLKYMSRLENPDPQFEVAVWAQKAAGDSPDVVAEKLAEAPDEKLIQARIGDTIRFNFKANRDCYLAMVNVGTSGKVSILFPNRIFPDGRIEAGKVYRTRRYKGDREAELPFTISIKPQSKPGRELVKIIASLKPFKPETLAKQGQQGSQFVEQITQDLVGEGARGLVPVKRWATDYVFIETSP
ncbi:MAG: DUF4384 domain-containing protein [Candidatus Latescibacteria bacterium]|nr:DUF4384 domain-containing protein [Candidatus Latescibacterota bacterium]